jgi:putative CRISPR-associated protein (TIGR02619 family)
MDHSMPNFIVSTCGTSLLTADASNDIRNLLTAHANTQHQQDIPDEVQTHVTQRLALFAQAHDLKTLKKQSAELAGLIAFYGGATLQGKDHHVLIATDTYLGEQGATAIAAVLQQHGHSTEVKRCTDLRTNDLSAYRTALSSLVHWAYETIPSYQASNYRVVFNLTGGFKAVQGFMQTLGALLADECVYVFERSNELIRLPRLPIQMQAEAWVRDKLSAFRRMALGLPVSAEQVQGIPEVLLFSMDGETTLSEWGEMVWREVKPTLYAEQLWPSTSAKLTWGDGFERSVSHLEDRRRMTQVNERIDELVRYLEKGQNSKGLDFKAIKGPPQQGATWEMDAWQDGSAKRLFGHYDESDKSVFVLDRLDRALH